MNGSTDTGTGSEVFARTADLFQCLGPDPRENIETVVSGALSVIGGSFALYVEPDNRPGPVIRAGAGLPRGLARDLDGRATCFSALPESGDHLVRFTAGDDPLLDTYGIRTLAGAVVAPGNRPSGMLWVADTVSREFTADEIQALRSLAGALAAQSVPDRSREGTNDLATLSRKVAHDLNNILAGLVSYPELMLMQLQADSPLKEPLAFIHESGQLASDIVQDFLFLVRPRSHEAPVIDPAPVIRAYFTGSAHAALKSSYPGLRFSHTQDTTARKIRISEILLTRIITILMDHSAQNAPRDSRVCLTLSGQEGTADRLRIRVTDSGPPVSPDHLPRFFEPYYAKKKMGRSGSGLDLAVLKRTILDHGGNIDIHCPGTGGNAVDVFFPCTAT